MTQRELAGKLGRYRSFASAVGKGPHRVTVVEFLDFADAIGFDPRSAGGLTIKVARAARPPSSRFSTSTVAPILAAR